MSDLRESLALMLSLDVCIDTLLVITRFQRACDNIFYNRNTRFQEKVIISKSFDPLDSHINDTSVFIDQNGQAVEWTKYKFKCT